jgi:hypothetical protein
MEDTLSFVSVIEKIGGRNVSEAVLLKEVHIKDPRTKSFWGKVVSGKQFGLLTVEGRNYTLTEWAKLILRPKDEESKKETLRNSFMNPELYKELCEKFGGQQILPVKTLANILYHDHRINVNASSDAAKAFVESAAYVGLLDADNVLKTSETNEISTPSPTSKPESIKAPIGTFTVPIILSNGIAYVTLPTNGITKSDNEKLKKLVELYITEEAENEEGF